MKQFLWLLIILCPYVSMARQTPVLKVGDKVPNVLLNNVNNYKSNSARLYDFKSKLLLIDLWATTCSSCIGELKMLDSLQKVYPDKFSVVAFNSLHDNRERLDKLMKRLKLKVSIPMVLGNKEMQSMLPHFFVPHFAWLDSGFKVLAITGSTPVTPAKISGFLNGGRLDFSEEDMVAPFDYNQWLFKNGNAGDGKQLLARSSFSNHIPGIPALYFPFTDSTGKVARILLTNQTVEQLLIRAYHYVPEKQVFKWEGIPLTGDFSYELITPPITEAEAIILMQEDLRRYLRITAEEVGGTLYIKHLPN